MTNSKKPQDQKTQASATELDESELQNVEGGAGFLKIGGIEGDRTGLLAGADQIKFGDKSIDGSKLQLTDKVATNVTKIKF